MRVERHIFGSIDGYRTLAHSPALNAADCKALEGFAFGTSYDPAIRATLSKQPAYWSRPLSARRRAITLVRPGEPDDAGRPTLLFATCVIGLDDWNDVLDGDATPLLQLDELWTWKRGARADAVDAAIDGPSALALDAARMQAVLGIISLVEVAFGTRRPVILREAECDLQQFIAVERLLPPDVRERISAVHRALNGDMAVTINCLVQNAAAPTSAPIRKPVGAASPYARRLVEAGVLAGRDAGTIVRTYNHFAQTEVEAHPGAGEEGIMRFTESGDGGAGARRSGVMAIAMAAVAFVAGGATGWSLHRPPPPPPPSPWVEIARAALDVPLGVGQARLDALQVLSTMGDSESEEYAEWRKLIGRKIEFAKLALQADEAIALIDPSNADSVARAKQAVEALKDQDSTLYAVTEARLTERRNLLEDATLRLGNAALALVPADSDSDRTSGQKLTPDEIESAWCLKNSLERLRDRDRRLSTPAVATAIDALGRISPPKRRVDTQGSTVAAHVQAISSLKQVFGNLNKSLDGVDVDSRKFSIAKYDPIADALDIAADRTRNTNYDSDLHASNAFRRLAEVIRQLKIRIIQSMPTSVPAATTLQEAVERSISDLELLHKQLAKEGSGQSEAQMQVQSTLEALTKFRNEMDRKQ